MGGRQGSNRRAPGDEDDVWGPGRASAVNVPPRPLAVFLPSLAGGGAERTVLTVVRTLADAGERIDLVLGRAAGPMLPEVPAEARVVDLEARHVALALPSLVDYLRREYPRALLATLPNANVVACLASRIAGTRRPRLVLRQANVLDGVGVGGLRDRALVPLARLCYRWADQVIAVSEAVADDLIRRLGVPDSSVTVIPNPVDIKRVRQLSALGMPREVPPRGSRPRVLGVGRLVAEKGFGVLVRAVARARTTHDVELVILGEGAERDRLAGLAVELGIADAVLLPGFVANPYPVMAQASVIVLPSRREGMPNVLLEAMALGVPVIGTNAPGGTAEVLRHGRLGALVEVGDVDALAKSIVRELERPSDSAAIAAAAMTNDPAEIGAAYLRVLLGDAK